MKRSNGREGRRRKEEGQTLGVLPFLHNPIICAQRGRERKKERGHPRIGKSGDQRTLRFFLSCWDAAKRSERLQCEPLKKRENLLLHPSINPSSQTLKLRCFSSCKATGRKSDRNTEIQTNPRKKKMARGSSRGVKESPVAEKSNKEKKKKEDAGCQVWEMRENTLRNVTGVREAGVQGRKEKERGQHFG